jgi:hypothetical protein
MSRPENVSKTHTMDPKRLSDDLIISLIFKGDSVLYVKTGTKKNFPDFKMAHDTTDAEKIGQVRAFIHEDLGLTPLSVELLGHIQKDPRDFMQYFINAHIYFYRVAVPADQFITPPPGAAEVGFHDLKAGQEEGFSYKGRLMLDFLKDWTIPDFKRLDANDIRDWYNQWLGLHLKSAYQEYIDQDIDACRSEAECFTGEVDEIVKRTGSAGHGAPEGGAGTVSDGLGQLADLMARTAGAAPAAAPGAGTEGQGTQLAALEQIKGHLCGMLYGLNGSAMNDWERRLAYCLLGSLLKRTNVLIGKYGADGARPEHDQELEKLVSELESESLSPFETRRD